MKDFVRWVETGWGTDRDEVIAELEARKPHLRSRRKAGALRQIAKEGDTLAIGDVVRY